MIVQISGLTFLLVLLPITFIQLYQSEGRAPRELSKDTKNHVVLTHYDPVTIALINKLSQYNYPYTLIISDLTQALRLYDQGFNVVVGNLDDPNTYHLSRVEKAALVVTTANDKVNTMVAFNVREISDKVPIIAAAKSSISVEILKVAGCSHVFQMDKMMGQSLARRTIGGDALAHVIGQFGELLIAEAGVVNTPLVGKNLRESELREMVGINVIGIWERGNFQTAGPDSKISSYSVLVFAGTENQIKKYNEIFCIYNIVDEPAIIIGGGLVGAATSKALSERAIDYRIVERLPEIARDSEKFVVGDATHPGILEKAGIMKAPTVLITTNDDETNIYLTIYCRRLRPDVQIVSRATLERNVPTMHRAGADFVMSYASMGANTIFNLLEHGDILMIAEGLDVFKVKLPDSLVGKSLAETAIRHKTGCSVVAVEFNSTLQINPDPVQSLKAESEIILIGSVEAEKQFLKVYGN
jgi:Trk K+ transport system NAD-binding subunit